MLLLAELLELEDDVEDEELDEPTLSPGPPQAANSIANGKAVANRICRMVISPGFLFFVVLFVLCCVVCVVLFVLCSAAHSNLP